MIFSNGLSISGVSTLYQESLNKLSSGVIGFPSMFWGYQGKAQAYLDYFLSELDPMLSQRRMAAEVVSIERETFETSTVVLRPSSRWKGFKAGQYIALEIEIDGVRYRRNYSLSCSPKYYEETGKFAVTVKRVDKGRVSDFMNRSISVSDVVYISEAKGFFILPEQVDECRLDMPVFIAAGSGITPIRSMIDHLFDERSGDGQEVVTLIHYAKNEDDIIYRDYFERLAKQFKSFSYITHFSDTEGAITQKQLDRDCPDLKDKSIYMCGPQGFMQAVSKAAQSLSVLEQNIHSESFGGNQANFTNVDGIEAGVINFAFADRQVQSKGNKSLLELAELAGLKPKFGCRSGICHECKCRRPEGRLFNRMTGAPISEDQTHIQSCVTVPSGNLTLKQW